MNWQHLFQKYKTNLNQVVHQIPLNYKTKIHWLTKGDQLIQFGFQVKSKIKWFNASHNDLLILKSELALKVIFEGFPDLYHIINMINQGEHVDVLHNNISILNFQVFLAESNIDGKQYAAKAHQELQQEQQFQEIKALVQLSLFKSPYFPILIEIYSCESYHLAIEKVNEGQTLLTILQQYAIKNLPIEQTKSILKQLLNSLRLLKVVNIVHLHIKPENIIIDQTLSLKLLDFNNFEYTDKQIDPVQPHGTPGYMAPELFLEEKSSYNVQNDIFSVGCVFYEMLTGRRLFFEGVSITVFELNIGGHFDLQREDIESYSAFDLLSSMLVRDPKKRVTVEGALKHQFFNKCIIDESPSPSIGQYSEKDSFECETDTTIKKLPHLIPKMMSSSQLSFRDVVIQNLEQ